jgi:hypothetical protein
MLSDINRSCEDFSITCLHGEDDEWRRNNPVGVSNIQIEDAGDIIVACVGSTRPIVGIVRNSGAQWVGWTHAV